MKNAILLVTHVALRNRGGVPHIDDQTFHGIERWLEHFDTVTYAGLDQSGDTGESTVAWRSLAPLINTGRLNVLALPVGYRALDHVRHYGSVRSTLGDLIAQHQYLCFSIGALFGDWGAIAGLEAKKQGRPFAVWFDRVEHRVQLATLSSSSIKRQAKTLALLPAMKLYHEQLIRKATVGIFQGKDCFDYYKAHAANPQLVYDTHTKTSDLISDDDLERKTARILSGAPVRICYAGRAAPMKGPEDWIAALIALHRSGVAFEATWLGDGPSLPEMRNKVAQAGLSDVVHLRGHVSDRDQLLDQLRESDVFLFCHKTPESPRCLIEALVSGTPIVGYKSAYPEGLVEGFGGGSLTPVGDVPALVREIRQIDKERQTLKTLITQAAQSGRRFDEETVYRARAELIRDSLSRA
ncbi:glycosyltransferase [Hyphomicrobium sp.]|uniref:glycosyltransferase n=1 Tax=Hyphomicrobium sp. TaxID=82 RepID=UPI002E347157|nr:glycosyltransferase [Hyphomicrobium sp.]HEX2842501.1 glycosyltransferase [Hyphomicrobium sp.]